MLHSQSVKVSEIEPAGARQAENQQDLRRGRKSAKQEGLACVEKSSSALDDGGPVATETCDAGRHLPTAILLLAHRWATAQIHKYKYKVRQIRERIFQILKYKVRQKREYNFHFTDMVAHWWATVQILKYPTKTEIFYKYWNILQIQNCANISSPHWHSGPQ